jgi:UDP-glucuronate 4-epimerase
MKILVTGVAGFIGMHVAQALLARGDEIVGVDALADPYDVALKYARLTRIQTHPRFRFLKLDVSDRPALNACFAAEGFTHVLHLATQAGGGRAVSHPRENAQPNLVGFINVLEGCRQHGVPHMVYASSSNAYGGRRQRSVTEGDAHLRSASEIEARKMPNELMAQTYSRLHGLATTGLRFFTVYGPWGRADAAGYGFARHLLAAEPMPTPKPGSNGAGLTYVDDIVAGVLQALALQAPRTDRDAQARVLNIGSHDPVRLLDFIASLENAVGRDAELKMLAPQLEDMVDLEGQVSPARLELVAEHRATMPLAEGVQRFVHWYLSYHGLGEGRDAAALRRAVVFEAPSRLRPVPGTSVQPPAAALSGRQTGRSL